MSPRIATTVVAALLLVGCTTTGVDRTIDAAATLAKNEFGALSAWNATETAQRDAKADADQRLAKPLTADDAVAIALRYSPAYQALLSDAAAASAQAAQSGRITNPVFTFERLARREEGGIDLDIGRMIAVPLLDLLFLPSRLEVAKARQDRAALQAASASLETATNARLAWVRAVAAQQSVLYFEQVKQAAESGAELARRMQSVGNFSKLQRAREQAFYADASAQLARAKQAALATREALVRTLGLNTEQAMQLKLPDRLPDLPTAAKSEQDTQRALSDRLDVRLATRDLEALAKARGLNTVTSYVDGLHIAGVRNSESGKPPQKGYELEIPLPLFDFGDAKRAAVKAEYLAALNRTAQVAVDAQSQVRESYGSYRTAYDLAAHYRDEVVPLRKAIADEMLLKYNGMLIGVFELLADAREQIGSVILAIDAQRDFWLADAALKSTLLGKPAAGAAMEASARSAASSGGGH
ncbi:MAG: TolC family protein [Burkholderiales bacterium]|nr:TolC family protein [Betaproteobacteria bacterium]MDX2220489.1 TolC family protein [Burkholderiales bacterium]